MSAACGVAVAALVAAVPALAARDAATPHLSAKLVGTWSRKLTQSDVAHGKPQLPAAILVGATCKLSVKANGQAHLDCGRIIGHFNGSFTPLSGTSVRIDVGDGRPNSYRWHVAANHLTLTNVTDPSHDRITIFRGTWQRG